MRLLEGTGLAHDDVHMVPRFSEVKSRSNIDVSVKLNRTEVVLKLPVLASPMDSVSGPVMAEKLWELGGMAILHRYCDIGTQAKWVDRVVGAGAQVGAAVGVGSDAIERAEAVIEAGAAAVCVDVAHGHSILMRETLKRLREKFSKTHLMAGNVATVEGVRDLADWGADSIRIGIGNGSICSTRVQTAHGYPVMQQLFDLADARQGKTWQPWHDVQIIADGGHRTSGDINKSLGGGAHLVMLGSMLAGTLEAPGEIIHKSGKQFKTYRGMASVEAQTEWRGFYSSDEGISVEVPYKGPVANQVDMIRRGLISGMSYNGAENLQAYRERAIFKRVSHASTVEASTHILEVAGG